MLSEFSIFADLFVTTITEIPNNGLLAGKRKVHE